jgi:hypothetical protein
MRRSFSALSIILMIIGIVLAWRYGTYVEYQSLADWKLETSKVGVSAFSVYLKAGYYLIMISPIGTSKSQYLEIVDSNGYLTVRFDPVQATNYFNITTPGNYVFYIHQIDSPNTNLYYSSTTWEIQQVHPQIWYMWIGGFFVLMGVILLAYSLFKNPSPHKTQSRGRSK